jgi:hypothetical protein
VYSFDIQRGLTIRDEREIVDLLAPRAKQREMPLNFLDDPSRLVKWTGNHLGSGRGAHLTVDAGIGAGLGRDVVDTETAPKTSGGNGSKDKHQ